MKILLTFFLTFLTISINAQDDYEKFQQDSKWGIKYKDKVVLPAVYDYISTKFVIITKKDKIIDVYNLKNLQLLYSNIKAFEFSTSPDPYTIEIITKDGDLKVFSNDGIVTDYSAFAREEKSRSDFFKKSTEEEFKFLIKDSKVIVIHKDLRKNGERGYPFNTDYSLINGARKAVFINNKRSFQFTNFYLQLDTGFELEYSEEELFKPLKTSFIITEVKGKYGVWDFKDQKIILPFTYDKIISNQKYLFLQKDRLITFYPTISSEPKYKKLEAYIGNFARFQLPNGKKGWVDKKGREYFDD